VIDVSKGKMQLIRQGGLFILYSHGLDISTTGKTEQEARGRFQIIIDECTKAGVSKAGVCGVLMSLGWTQRAQRWSPPSTR
jgi:hypothetical protein